MRSREEYTNSVHKLGRITNLITILLMIAVPTIISIVTETPLNVEMFMTYGSPLVLVYTIVCVCEVLAYTPVLGAGGAYLSFITGNIGNMKIPAAVSAQNAIGAEKGSEQAEIAATLAISVSSIVTVSVLTIGVVFISYLTPFLTSPVLKPAFDNVMPALMGAFAMPILLADPKKSIAPLIAVLFLMYVAPVIFPPAIASRLPMFQMIIVVGVSLLASYISFNNKKKNA